LQNLFLTEVSLALICLIHFIGQGPPRLSMNVTFGGGTLPVGHAEVMARAFSRSRKNFAYKSSTTVHRAWLSEVIGRTARVTAASYLEARLGAT
jgi:hypothetical protein